MTMHKLIFSLYLSYIGCLFKKFVCKDIVVQLDPWFNFCNLICFKSVIIGH